MPEREPPPHQVPIAEAAHYVLQAARGDGISLSLGQLNAICYYAQGLYGAMRGERLFAEPVIATLDGPVFPDLMREFEGCGDDLPAPSEPVKLPRVLQASALRDAMRRFRRLEQDRPDDPWRAVAAACGTGGEIAPEEIADFIRRMSSSFNPAGRVKPDWDRAIARLQRPEVVEAVKGPGYTAAERERRWA